MSSNAANRERFLQFAKLIATVFCVSVTLYCGIRGWQEYDIGIGEAIYRTLGAFEFDEIYLDKPSDEAQPDVNVWLQWARTFGILTIISALVLTFSGFLSENWERFFIRFRKKDILILGSGPFCREAVQLAEQAQSAKKSKIKRRSKALHLGAASYSCRRSWLFAPQAPFFFPFLGRYIATLPWTDPAAPDAMLETHAQSGKHVLVSEEEDSETIELATKLRDMRTSGNKAAWSNSLQITAILRDARLAEDANVNWADGMLNFVDASRLAVRRLHRQFPPFLLADRFKHKEINALIVGFGDMGQAVAGDLAVNCCVADLRKPKITVIDPHVEARVDALRVRSPEFEELFDLNCITGAFGWGEVSPPNQSDVPDQISAVYICLSDDTAALAALSDVRVWLRRNEHLQVPIFIHLRHAEILKQASYSPLTDEGENDSTAPLFVFGDRTSILEESGFLDPEVDLDARRVHSAYCASRPAVEPTDESAVPWLQLKAIYKASNRAVVAHIPAKLHSMGLLTAEAYENSALKVKCPDFSSQKIEPPDESSDPSMQDDWDAMLLRLYRLEHERFVAERRWAGWQKADKKDTVLLHHDCFIPYDDLKPETQKFDKEIVHRVIDLLNGKFKRPAD